MPSSEGGLPLRALRGKHLQVGLEQPDAVAASFGSYRPMAIDAEAYGRLNAEATALLAEAGYE